MVHTHSHLETYFHFYMTSWQPMHIWIALKFQRSEYVTLQFSSSASSSRPSASLITAVIIIMSQSHEDNYTRCWWALSSSTRHWLWVSHHIRTHCLRQSHYITFCNQHPGFISTEQSDTLQPASCQFLAAALLSQYVQPSSFLHCWTDSLEYAFMTTSGTGQDALGFVISRWKNLRLSVFHALEAVQWGAI